MTSENPAPLIEFTHRPDLDILVSRWGHQPEPHELPVVYQEMTDVALHERARFWLQDIRRRTLNDRQTTLWLLNVYFPDMASRLGGRLFVAYLLSPALHEAIISQPNYISAEAYDDKPYAISFFRDEGAAIKWLQIQQTNKVG